MPNFVLEKRTVGSAYVASLGHHLPLLLCALVLTAPTTAAWGAEAQRQRRVLIVHSFGSGAPPFTVLATAFESTIKQGLGASVALDQVSLDMARYAQPDLAQPLAQFV